MCGMFFNIAENDALAKARGEPTRGFHNIQPNYSNPEIMAAVAAKKAGKSTAFYDTGVPNIWQQYASKESTPPVLRSLSSSGSSSNLSIRRGSSSTQKRSIASGRRTSKSKRFSTTR